MKIIDLSNEEVIVMFKTIIYGKPQRGSKKLAKKLIKFIDEFKKESQCQHK